MIRLWLWSGCQLHLSLYFDMSPPITEPRNTGLVTQKLKSTFWSTFCHRFHSFTPQSHSVKGAIKLTRSRGSVWGRVWEAHQVTWFCVREKLCSCTLKNLAVRTKTWPHPTWYFPYIWSAESRSRTHPGPGSEGLNWTGAKDWSSRE